MRGCTRTVWKTMLVPFSKFSCLLQGMDRYCDEMCGNSQPQMSVCWVFNYKKWNTCLKNMTPGMVPWYDLTMPCGKFEKVWLMSSRWGSSMLSRGKSPKLKGNPNFLCSLPWSFFLRRTYNLQITAFKFGIFLGSFTILGDYVHFLGINPHNSNLNNRCLKRCTRTV